MKTYKRRDLTILDCSDSLQLVVVCDSCGGIGEKAGDACHVPAYYVGKLTARVVLYEIMCAGSTPVVLSNGTACEMNPTGREILSGLQEELQNAGLKDVVITGSTEENFATSMTAMGMTAVGVAKANELKFQGAAEDDHVILFGRPAVGLEVVLTNKGLYDEIKSLLHNSDVREIIPVGSKGIAYEADTIAALNGLIFRPRDTDIDLRRSAGPVCCIIAVCKNTAVSQIQAHYSQAVIIGSLHLPPQDRHSYPQAMI
jgi:hypothetical protein